MKTVCARHENGIRTIPFELGPGNPHASQREGSRGFHAAAREFAFVRFTRGSGRKGKWPVPIAGSSKGISLADLVQANSLGRNTCRVVVTAPRGKGSFHMEDGEIVDAAYGDLVGEAAFYALMNAADATFSANSGVKPTARRIDAGLETLMLNAMILRFEGRVPEAAFSPSQGPSPDASEPPSFSEAPKPPAGADRPGSPSSSPRAAVPVEPPASPSAAVAMLPTAPSASRRDPPKTAVPGAPAPALAKKRAGRFVLASGLLVVVAAGAYIALVRLEPPPSTRTGPALPIPSPSAPVESASLTASDDIQPELLSGNAPSSPDPESAISPTIICRILIGEDGAVREASVFRSRLDLATFEEAAITTVKAYRFRPARRAGRAVPVWTNFQVSFK